MNLGRYLVKVVIDVLTFSGFLTRTAWGCAFLLEVEGIFAEEVVLVLGVEFLSCNV
jgi:hypothetical protein